MISPADRPWPPECPAGTPVCGPSCLVAEGCPGMRPRPGLDLTGTVFLPSVSSCPEGAGHRKGPGQGRSRQPLSGQPGARAARSGGMLAGHPGTLPLVKTRGTRLTGTGSPGKLCGLPRIQAEACGMVCVRFLRTQQRAKSQCTCITPSAGAGPVTAWFLVCGCQDRLEGRVFRFEGLLLVSVACWLGFARLVVAYRHSTESLILAQDERWRRA